MIEFGREGSGIEFFYSYVTDRSYIFVIIVIFCTVQAVLRHLVRRSHNHLYVN